jgi:formylglycine-generating enzyme required for sulfatase activity
MLLLFAGIVGCSRDASGPPLPLREVADPFDGSRAGDALSVAGIRLRWCPAGRYLMGSPPGEPERRPGEDQVEVTLTCGFWIGQDEVTQRQWKQIVGTFPGKQSAGEGDDYPLTTVNFAEAEQFCRKATEAARAAGELPKGWEFRLPTEAQWEYACRAGTRTATAFGDHLSSTQANFRQTLQRRSGRASLRKAAVRLSPNRGASDMHGNVFEWCRDWYHARLPGGPNQICIPRTPPRRKTRRGPSRGSAGAAGG